MPLDQITNEQIDKLDEELKESEMSFLDHLEVLRWHLIRSLVAISVFTIIAFIYGQWIFKNIIFAPSRPDFWTYRQLCALGKFWNAEGLCIDKLNFQIQSTSLTGQFMMYFTACFVFGIIVAFPYFFWEIWRFVQPGLYNKERKASRGAVFSVSLLFTLGILFGYYVVAPLSINFLSNFTIDPNIKNDINIVSYVSTLTTLVLACAVLFQLPVFVFFFAQIGLLTPKFMRTYRRHAIVLILIISGIITPPDIFSQVLISMPLLLLYEISIMIAGRVEKRRLAAEKAMENND